VYFSFTSSTVAPPNPPGASSPPNGSSVISRFIVPVPANPGDPLAIDTTSRFDISWGFDIGSPNTRWVVQPFSNHNGGTINFGPDGYLYFGLGDGGSEGDPNQIGQNPVTQLSKMHRLDVSVPDSDTNGCAIPPSNPFLQPNAFPTSRVNPTKSNQKIMKAEVNDRSIFAVLERDGLKSGRRTFNTQLSMPNIQGMWARGRVASNLKTQ
jgi:hypothetical protein